MTISNMTPRCEIVKTQGNSFTTEIIIFESKTWYQKATITTAIITHPVGKIIPKSF